MAFAFLDRVSRHFYYPCPKTIDKSSTTLFVLMKLRVCCVICIDCVVAMELLNVGYCLLLSMLLSPVKLFTH